MILSGNKMSQLNNVLNILENVYVFKDNTQFHFAHSQDLGDFLYCKGITLTHLLCELVELRNP